MHSPSPTTAKLPIAILEEAATWYVQLHDATAFRHDIVHWQQWLERDEQHRLAWQQMQALESRLHHVPGKLAIPTLQQVGTQRRKTIKLLAIMLATGSLTWAGYETIGWRHYTAAYRTAAGERRRITLADGGMLDINAQSSVDVDYRPDIRVILLHAGEILIQTAPDTNERPFEVHSPHGEIRALGTRFSVRSDAAATRVMVFEDTVRIRPANATAPDVLLHAGQEMTFTTLASSSQTAIPAYADAWTQGKLIVNDMALSDVVAQLARYRPGYLLCDPAVANLRVSGTFRLDDPEGILANLAASLPVHLRYVTRYWVRIEALHNRSG